MHEQINNSTGSRICGAYFGHGGGDERRAADFVKLVRGEKLGLVCTSIFDSMTGHMCVYKADQSREQGCITPNITII